MTIRILARVLMAALTTFFSWVVLNGVWIVVLVMMVRAKARRENIPPSPGYIATDISGVLFHGLFHSPWYWVTVAILMAAVVVFGRHWVLSGR